MVKRKKTRILWDRVFIAIFILILLIMLIIAGFSKLFGKTGDDSSLPESSVVDDSSETAGGNTYNANYDYITYENNQIFYGDLLLVNNSVAYSMDEPTDCVAVIDNKTSDYYVKDNTVYVKPVVMDALNKMAADFVAAKGNKNLMIRSGFRTKERQQELYDEDLASTGSAVSTFVAMPGYSEHHTGYAVDFGVYPVNNVYKEYDGTGDFAWINENCYKYGFIVRYELDKVDKTGISNEPWHFRYVGESHATIMHELDLCYEEYIEYLKRFEFDKEHCVVNTSDGGEYEVYYVPMGRLSTELPVPKNYSYTVSGNNVDGFIVTMKIK